MTRTGWMGIGAAVLAATAFLALVAAVSLAGGNPGYTKQFVPADSETGTSEVLLVIAAVAGVGAVVAGAAFGVLRVRESHRRSNPDRF